MEPKVSFIDDPTWRGLVSAQLLRISSELHDALGGRSTAELANRANARANPVGWLTWHLTRSHDRNISEIAGECQVWTQPTWHEMFGRRGDPNDTGYGHTVDEVGRFDPVSVGALLGYHDAVIEVALGYLSRAPESDLGRLAPSPTLHMTASVQRRLVGVLNEGFQHLSQIRMSLG
jgi:hypothetical protein